MNRPDIEKLRKTFENNPTKLELLESLYKNIETENFPEILKVYPNTDDNIRTVKKIYKLLGYKLIGSKDENNFFIIKSWLIKNLYRIFYILYKFFNYFLIIF